MKDTVPQNVKPCASIFGFFNFLEILLEHFPILSLTLSCSQHPYLLQSFQFPALKSIKSSHCFHSAVDRSARAMRRRTAVT